ncbi:Protein O-GlcNAc transferase protein [Dioscorea alata]|uniref:Protein O-GlcNAc transferase protein n=2 Tax=Dioscorea alata TaxID=55571 RepID=A0ACB7UE32_DIOAL|nr:Protein O-GlcNAc transferase protein [Dioscorea alata]
MIRMSIMGHKKKLVMSFRYMLLVGCLLATMTAITLFVPNSVPFNALSFRVMIHSAEMEIISELENQELKKPLCNVSEPRSEVCDMNGDIRIHGNSSSVLFIRKALKRRELYRIRPYARKGDEAAMSSVKQVTVRSSEAAPQCDINHSVPGIIFSVNGYTGNLFHDFTDVLIPLFVTAREFDKEVQFLVTDFNPWWIRKYQLVISQLSKYNVIDMDKDKTVHCFKHVIVGLKCHKELSIDRSKVPKGYSMLDFTRFIRNSYSLNRETPIRIVGDEHEEMNYNVVIGEASATSNMTQFAEIVNSCDVLMGVHGAGLTNLVFLPTNAVFIQIVPWGGLKWLAMYDFGNPAKDMKLKYLQYEINPEESSLIEEYPRDHLIFKNPISFHKQGWNSIQDTFMNKQNIKLDLRRFRAVLLEALKQLHQ